MKRENENENENEEYYVLLLTVFSFEDNGRSSQRRQEEIAANNSPTVSHPSWTEKKLKTRDAGNYKHENEAKKRKMQIH